MREQDKIPSHVGLIMDGNGRWAKTRGLPRVEGHRRGVERVREIIDACLELEIKALTLYTFSLENWQRPQQEVGLLMQLLEYYLKAETSSMARKGIRFKAIGETWRLPGAIQKLISEAEALTANNSTMTLVAALSYGGRDEIVRAVKKAIASGMPPESITEESLGSLMDTSGLPDPDLIIRTSGEMRLSNFLLWQSAYSELYFTNTLWPDFSKGEFMRAIDDYGMRERRFGAIPVNENIA